MTAELLRWRAQQSRYFADPDASPPPELLAAIAVDVAPKRSRLIVCHNCFREGHEANACPSAGVPCSSCGGSGHMADECPMYLMDLSIRGSLKAYVEQRRGQAAPVAADKGRFPAKHSDGEIQSRGRPSDMLGSSCKGETNVKHNESSPTFSAVQCVICGKLGHANCGPPPPNSGAAYCPRCAQIGHMGAQCRGIFDFSGFHRPPLLEQMAASDPWKHAAQRGRAQGKTGLKVLVKHWCESIRDVDVSNAGEAFVLMVSVWDRPAMADTLGASALVRVLTF
ncbi:hypothetical protein Esti_000975 [Eimeria stiedai]